MSTVDKGGSQGPQANPVGGSRLAPVPSSDALERRLAEIMRVPPRGTDTAGPAARRPRADARDNRQRLLAAADTVFGAEGVGASLDLIAREAGVGRATLYRHFPSREALLAALYDGLISSIETQARALGERTDALFELLSFYVDQVARRATLIDHWVSLTPDTGLLLRGRSRLIAVLEPLLERAISTGHCRPGITGVDMLVVLTMLTPRPTGRTGEERRVMGRRALDLLLAGLRP